MKQLGLYFVLFSIAAAPAAGQNYLCFGDSITYANTGRSDAGYLAPLANYLGATAVMTNSGQPGEAVHTGGVNRIGSAVSGGSFQTVLVLEGTNDLFQWVTPFSYTLSDSKSSLGDLISTAKGSGRTVIVATIPPLNGNLADPDNRAVDDWNDAVRSVAASKGVAVAEVNEALSGYVNSFTYDDSVHPSTLGHTLVAEAFAAAITGQPLSSVDLAPPIPESISPKPFSSRVSLSTDVEITVVERKHPFDAATAVLKIDGQMVTPQISASSNTYHYTYAFPSPLNFGQKVDVEFIARDTATPPNELVLSYDFRASAGNGTGGDVDKSSRVDGKDLAILSGSFGAGRKDSRYNIAADIDASGFVDGVDLAILSGKFGGPP